MFDLNLPGKTGGGDAAKLILYGNRKSDRSTSSFMSDSMFYFMPDWSSVFPRHPQTENRFLGKMPNFNRSVPTATD